MLTTTNNKTHLSDGAYAFGKTLVQLYIPALSALYFGLGKIWGFPSPEQVVGSLAVLAVFLGSVLHLSSSNYDASGAAYDGQMVVSPGDGKTVYSLELHGDPADLPNKDSVNFKVVPPEPETTSVPLMPAPPTIPKAKAKKKTT